MNEEMNQNEQECCANDSAVNCQKAGECNQELERAQAEAQAWQEKYLRSNADFQNYMRRMEKERSHWMIAAQTDVFSKLLIIVDDFDRAMAEQSRQDGIDNQGMFAGFAMIHASLQKLLKEFGIEEITELGNFDPEKHEAIVTVDAPGIEVGSIVEVLQKGYTAKGLVLRPAKVSVAR